MRRRFNCGRYWARLRRGELTATITEQRHPAPEHSGQPHCTQSQGVTYFDKRGNEIARVHQYLRPDGRLGGGGKPDPKRIFENGVLYRLDDAYIPRTFVERLKYVISKAHAKLCAKMR
jgi:hypothetical protein